MHLTSFFNNLFYPSLSTLFSTTHYQYKHNKGAQDYSKVQNLIYFQRFHMIRWMNPPNLTNCITHHEDVCLADCATTHTIIRDKKYFPNLAFALVNVNTISSSINLIQGSEKSLLLGETKFNIKYGLYSTK